MNIASSIHDLIGRTPLVRVNSLSQKAGIEIVAKAEFFNPLSSVKDRIGKAMILKAIEAGALKEGAPIVEGTSGNTGIALAYIGASLGYQVILTMPESMSIERRNLLKALGAKLVLTPADQGMTGANNEAAKIAKETGGLHVSQFKNEANPQIHYQTTAPEIWEDTDGKLDAFVAGVGTGGTVTGVGRFLKEKSADIRIVAVEPIESAILSGQEPGKHKIQGIGAGFIPDIYDASVVDEIIKVSSEEAMQTSRDVAKNDGILVGISAGANLAAAVKLAQQADFKGDRIVTILCDTGERYLSTPLFEEA